MRLYAAGSQDFVKDANQNLIAEKLKASWFDQCRYPAPEAEVRAWHNSLRAMSGVLMNAGLKDNGVIIEYSLPLTSKRLDFMITGQDLAGADSAVIVELKQWDKTKETEGERLLTYVGGGERPMLHPSVQVGQYCTYLADTHTAFYDGDAPIALKGCAFLHNYSVHPNDPLIDARFDKWTTPYPVFTQPDAERLGEHLYNWTGKGNGLPLLDKIDGGRYKPSKKLMDHVAGVIKGDPRYILLDEQLVVLDRILALSRHREKGKGAAIVVKGGPGTGKSVIALNLMAQVLSEGRNAHYATGSKAFTETLRSIIGSRGSTQFKYFNSYVNAEPASIDLMIADEAHRIRITSNNRFTPAVKQSKLPQITELFNVAKTCVFFVDDAQVVRPGEIGSVSYIREKAAEAGLRYEEYQLEAQFRCGGSDGFVNWVDNTLEVRRTANVLWEGADGFEFKIMDSPAALDAAIRAKAAQGYTARLTAGYCWAWSHPKNDGTLEDDVVLGDFKRPWNARPDSKGLAKGIPSANLWAHKPGGMEQIGCVYTAQGFEFDYAGVIIGPDLVYRFDEGGWKGDKTQSKDHTVKRTREGFIDFVKNTYRVLLSRGMKGCYVYFQDKETERFFRSRMGVQPPVAANLVPFRPKVLSDPGKEAYRSYLPLVDLEAAAGYFGPGRAVSTSEWVEVPGKKLNKNMFVAQIKGRSMAPTLMDGDYCVFEAGVQGSRNGKIVLAEHRGVADPETGGSYSVKFYYSEKEVGEDDWAHTKILLKPLNPEFQAIEIPEDRAGEFRVVAEYREKLGVRA